MSSYCLTIFGCGRGDLIGLYNLLEAASTHGHSACVLLYKIGIVVVIVVVIVFGIVIGIVQLDWFVQFTRGQRYSWPR